MTESDRARTLAAGLFELLGRWVPTEPDLESKLLFARHSMTIGAHVMALDAAGASRGDELASELDGFAGAATTEARLDAAYRRAMPLLVAAYASAGVSDDLRRDAERVLTEGGQLLAGAP